MWSLNWAMPMWHAVSGQNDAFFGSIFIWNVTGVTFRTTERWGHLILQHHIVKRVSFLKAVQSGKCLPMQSWHGIHKSAKYDYFELQAYWHAHIYIWKIIFILAVPPLPQCLTNINNYFSLENLQNTKFSCKIIYDNNKTPISLYHLLTSSEEKTGLNISDRFCTFVSWI